MKGTEKQIKWAEDIIREARDTIKRNIELIDREDAVGIRTIERQCFVECGKSLETMLAEIDNASKIIDMRDLLSSRSVLAMVNAEANKRRANK